MIVGEQDGDRSACHDEALEIAESIIRLAKRVKVVMANGLRRTSASPES